MKPKPFEELLAGATSGPWKVSSSTLVIATEDARDIALIADTNALPGVNNIRATEALINAQYFARLEPAVMREVWGALKEAGDPNNWFYDEGAYQMVCRKNVQTRCRRALAALNGEKTENKEPTP